MILNKAQAEAVYSAMCALNNVSAAMRLIQMRNTNNHTINVREDPHDGAVTVSLNIGGIVRERDIERHADQNAFAIAYGLE